jgi:HSP20 family protein
VATLTRRDPFRIDLPALFETMLERPATMRLEEYVEDNTLVVRAEIPGIDPDKDVEISAHDGVLTIKAERSEKSEKKAKSFYRSEFRYGAFARTVPLPAGATVDDVKATYKDGVLEIRVPTPSATAKSTRVPVQKVV